MPPTTTTRSWRPSLERRGPVDKLKAAIALASSAAASTVFVGSAYKNKGIQELLDAVDYLPSRLTSRRSTAPRPGARTSVADIRALLALAFKIADRPVRGQLTYIRVYSGQAEAGSYVYNSVKDNRERLEPRILG